MDPGPVLAVETRSGRDEAVHCGHAVMLASDGEPRRAWGDPGQATYWRSSAKPLQAIPFTQTLATFGLGPRELAVACGSHAGEAPHVEAVRRILDASKVPEDALRCGIHPPWGKASAFTKASARPVHNNCSGKHAGMLAACRANGWDLDGYLDAAHPLQRAILEVVGEATGLPSVGHGVDGCGVPTFHTSLLALARSFQWLGGSRQGPQVLDAMGAHPLMVSGSGEFCTGLAEATKGRVMGKYGALGCYAAIHRSTGEAFALRVTTGGEKACKALVGTILAREGWLRPAEAEALAAHVDRPVTNHAGRVVGALEFRL